MPSVVVVVSSPMDRAIAMVIVVPAAVVIVVPAAVVVVVAVIAAVTAIRAVVHAAHHAGITRGRPCQRYE